MKFRTITLAAAVVLGGSTLMAQTPQHDALMNSYHYVQGQIRPAGEDLGNIQGTPYYKDGFQESNIYFPDSDPVEAKVRYNVVKEEMQVLFDYENFRVLHDGIMVEINGVPFQKYSYKGGEKGVDLLGYFEILTKDFEDKSVLLIRKPVKEVKEGKKTLRMQTAFPSKYMEKSELYLKFENSVRAIPVEKSTKKFVESFPEEHQDKLAEFIKSNKYKTKDAEDLLAIVDYYNANF